ncbi:MAG: hypothetical protein COA42_14140 [Alteromonadaceae bacterium]|nr:MAG: hypothetical protein COA42_14140 [Alteromonadaceae bacterium]
MRHLVQWFIDNPIAANLLMIAMLLGGWYGAVNINKEVFPSTAQNYVDISMSYPGAAPTEVEEQIVIRIEEAVADIVGIFQITSTAQQGVGVINIEIVDGYNVKDVLNNVKNKVDSISTLPNTGERPLISQRVNRVPLMFFSLFGDVDLSELKSIAYSIRDEMAILEGIAQVVITGGLKNDEVAIEISEYNLRRYNLTFDEIAAVVRKSSINLPAGTVRTEKGNIQIQTRAQAYKGHEFADIVLRNNPDGSFLKLGDIANITDGFEEVDVDFFYNGIQGLDFQVLLSDDPQLIEGTASAKKYIEELRERLPAGVDVKIGYTMKEMYDNRFSLLKDNALGGLALVFIILMLFLRPVIAIWVVAGIATTFAGTIWLLPYFGISFNMLSMFALIMVLGIVVDDAIIVGESIYSQQSKGIKGKAGSSIGAIGVLKPVTLAVISTILFFLPMIGVPSDVKPFTESIFYVVLLSLSFSLIESLLILPSHLTHMKPETPSKHDLINRLTKIRHIFSDALASFAKNIYQPSLKIMLHNKWSALAGFFSVFVLSLSLFAGGWMKTQLFPNVPNDFILVNVTYPAGSPVKNSYDIATFIEEKALALQADKEFLEKNAGNPFISRITKGIASNTSYVFIGLKPAEDRIISIKEVTRQLKENIGSIPEAQSYSLGFTINGAQPDISLNLNIGSNDRALQRIAVQRIIDTLSAYPGVENVRSDLDSDRSEVEMNLKAHAQHLGISLSDIATQVRQSFYGEEIQRIPRSKEDVRVMLRYPKEDRSTLDTLDSMRVRNSKGIEIPLHTVSEVSLVPGFSTINRTDRLRNISITADVQEDFSASEIADTMMSDYTPQWQREFHGFKLSKGGNLRTQAMFGSSFGVNFGLIFLVVLAVFMVAFRSIFQPFLVLLAVPFGLMGAIFGHMLFGNNISMMSAFGFLACAGVVVNDNLVLLDRINQLRQQGASAFDAVANAGIDRFRAITLTSLTTFVGLMPILFERSLQAQFLIPMVISLAFGVLFASVVTLYLVPCAYLIGIQIGNAVKRGFRGFIRRCKIFIYGERSSVDAP